MNDARNWKWMVPGAFFGLAILFTRFLLLSPNESARWFSVVPGFITVMCGLATIGNFYDYRREQAVRMLERRQSAMSRTPLSVELDASRGVSPEVAKILINERHRVWMMKSGVKSEGITPHSVLFGAPDVTEYFLQYFLESSTEKMVMPKRLLSDGRKNRFDPWGVVDEYTMYDRLIALLARQGKVRRWSEFDSYEWVEPWTPALVAEDFGLAWEEDDIGQEAHVEQVSETNKQYAMTVKQLVELNQKNQKEKKS